MRQQNVAGKDKKRSPKALPGVVASVVAPQDAARASAAREQAVVRAAVAYVAARKDAQEYSGSYVGPWREKAALDELVRAVEGLGNTGDKPC